MRRATAKYNALLALMAAAGIAGVFGHGLSLIVRAPCFALAMWIALRALPRAEQAYLAEMTPDEFTFHKAYFELKLKLGRPPTVRELAAEIRRVGGNGGEHGPR